MPDPTPAETDSSTEKTGIDARSESVARDRRAQDRRRRWLGAAILGGVIAGLYAPSLGGEFVIDDRHYIVENPAVLHGAALRDLFLDARTTSSNADYRVQVYRPLRTLAFRAVVVGAGVHRRAFALANLALYLLSGALLFALVQRVLVRRSDDNGAVDAVGKVARTSWAALWGVALWALMPVHVEPVVYASALGDQLSLALGLGSLLVGLSAMQGSTRSAIAKGVASTILLACALGAKEMAVVGPLLLALVTASRFGAASLRRGRVIALLAVQMATVMGFVALRTRVLGQLGQAPVTRQSVVAGMRAAPVLLGEYARITLAPVGHTVAYVIPRPSSTIVAMAACALAALTLLVVGFFLRRTRIGDGPRGAAIGVAWFVLALVPVLQLVPIKADLADRFVLLPSAGVAIVVAAMLRSLNVARARLALAPLILWSAFDAAGVVLEAEPWTNDAALWRHAVAAEPRSALAHYNLGIILLREQRDADALSELDRAVALGRNSAETQMRRSVALTALDRPGEALAAVDAALVLDDKHAASHFQRGVLLLAAGDLSQAAAAVARALELNPDQALFSIEAGRIAEARGQHAEAVAHFQRAATLNAR